MKEMFLYYIDIIVFGVILSLAYGIVKYFKIEVNFIYLALGVVVVFTFGKMALRSFLNKRTS